MLAAIKTILVRRSLITYNDSRIFLVFDVSVMQPNKLFVFPDHGKVTLLENRQRGLENNEIKCRKTANKGDQFVTKRKLSFVTFV